MKKTGRDPRRREKMLDYVLIALVVLAALFFAAAGWALWTL